MKDWVACIAIAASSFSILRWGHTNNRDTEYDMRAIYYTNLVVRWQEDHNSQCCIKMLWLHHKLHCCLIFDSRKYQYLQFQCYLILMGLLHIIFMLWSISSRWITMCVLLIFSNTSIITASNTVYSRLFPLSVEYSACHWCQFCQTRGE